MWKCRRRAQWNASLEKDLVDLLREHDTPEHKGQNGWSSEAWNTIVKKFHQKNPYARYEKKKIQEKEKELKKEYKMIKEIRKQSGVSRDDRQCKILADPPLWKNIIIVRMSLLFPTCCMGRSTLLVACSNIIFLSTM